MTGGTLYLRRDQLHQINEEYVTPLELDDESSEELKGLITDYFTNTNSETAKIYLESWADEKSQFIKLMPNGVLEQVEARLEEENEKQVSLKRAEH